MVIGMNIVQSYRVAAEVYVVVDQGFQDLYKR